jgi:hypothetical protein
MTAVDILIFIAKHKGEVPNLKRYSPVQVSTWLPEKDERYKQGEEGLRAVLGRS